MRAESSQESRKAAEPRKFLAVGRGDSTTSPNGNSSRTPVHSWRWLRPGILGYSRDRPCQRVDEPRGIKLHHD